MKCKIVIAFLIVISSISLYSQETPLVSVPQTNDKGIPANWMLGGSNPQDYSVGVDLSESYSGFASAYIKSTSARPVGFTTLLQSFKANNYRSQRIKLTAYLKTRFVGGWSALWMRVNDISGKPLAFDDMRERPLIGSMEWKPLEIVLDVPATSDEISFGFLLQGKGQVWIDNIKITMVGEDVPVTDILNNKSINYSPKNLDFEE
jgi:AraC family transcriptional regulator